MNRDRFNRKYFIGALLLLLTPVLVIAGFAIYVHLANAKPQSAPLQSGVKPEVVFPWQEATYLIDFDGNKESAKPAPQPPVDIAFLIDVSGSMTSSLGAMASAAHQVAKELADAKPGDTHFALIRFDSEAAINTRWTPDPEKLYEGLHNLGAFTGDNDTREAFVRLNELLKDARPEAKKVAVFYTDGGLDICSILNCPTGPMSQPEIIRASEELRSGGVEIYSIGLPSRESPPLMIEMTGSASHVFDPTNTGDLIANFRLLVDDVVAGRGEGGQLSHKLDGRFFSVPLEGTRWSLDRSGSLNLGIGKLAEAPTKYSHPLVPLSTGLWRVGINPPALIFTDRDGKVQRFAAERRPLILVITWFALLLMFLPALVWMLAPLFHRERIIRKPEILLPDIIRPRLPGGLPALPAARAERQPPIPTLFVGLGGAGRRALQATRAELKEAHWGREGFPYRFLWIDLDINEKDHETPFDDWPEYPITPLLAPSTIRQAERYALAMTPPPDHLQWFDAYPYQNAPRSQLDLSQGTRGDRRLARRALFQWLAEDELLFATLAAQCQELAALDSVDGTRQIVVFGSAAGGTGSGWFLDIGRLLHRLARRQQKEGLACIPEIIGVLNDLAQSPHPENRTPLSLEIESATLNGAFPQQVTYVPQKDLLDQVDTESPYAWIFAATELDDDSVAAQASELAAVLVERLPRAALLGATRALEGGEVISTLTQAIHVRPSLVYEHVRVELFLSLVGQDILLDILNTQTGGYAPKPVPEAVALEHLMNWMEAEPVDTPLRLLLRASTDSIYAGAFLTALKAFSPTPEWLGAAFSASLSRRLHGHGNPDGLTWRRDWMPCEAIVTLRLLADRLDHQLKPELMAADNTTSTVEIIDHISQLARSAADHLEKWVQDFCGICETVGQRRNALARLQEKIQKLRRRTYIDPPNDQERVKQWAKASLETWLGTPDTISAICERLFFTTTAEGARMKVIVRSCIEGVRDFYQAAPLAEKLDAYASQLARTVPVIQIDGALSLTPEAQRNTIANNLVHTRTTPRRVLLVTPGREAPSVVEAFKSLIPQPASHGSRLEERGDDSSAIRRIEMDELTVAKEGFAQGPLYFTEAAEQAAELLRQRAEKKYKIVVPPFPPELRIALAHPAAFKSFARAYKAGHIVHQLDSAGARQWGRLHTAEFLTFEDHHSLASAAANYVWHIRPLPQTFTPVEPGGSFAKLEQWLRERSVPDDDTLCLIAIDISESEEAR
jgi:von Willebrand factor type A domain-containing protein/tubulin-like protein